MEFFNSDFFNEMRLTGVFMCRLIKNMADNSIDLLIYRQNPNIIEKDDPLGLVQGKRLSSLENEGVFLPTDFWQNIERRGAATCAFTADGFHFQLHVFEVEDNYLLNVYRKAVEPLGTIPQSFPSQAEEDELKNTQKQLFLANERLKLAIKAKKIGILDFNALSKTFILDDETCRIYGVPIGFKPTMEEFFQLIHPDDKTYLLNKITTLASDPDPDIEAIRIIRPDGKIRFVY